MWVISAGEPVQEAAHIILKWSLKGSLKQASFHPFPFQVTALFCTCCPSVLGLIRISDCSQSSSSCCCSSHPAGHLQWWAWASAPQPCSACLVLAGRPSHLPRVWICGINDNNVVCLCSASLPVLYNRGKLFPVCAVLVSIQRTCCDYFCAWCDLYPTQGSGNWLQPSPSHGIQQRYAVPREILYFWGSNLENLQSGVMGYPTFVFLLTAPISLFFSVAESVQQLWLQEKCALSLSQETRSHTGWFAISFAWEIKVSSLFKTISPKAISLPSLSCCFCLYLFCLADYCYCGFSLFPTHWGGSLDQKKDIDPSEGPESQSPQVSTRVERMQTHKLSSSSPMNPPVLAAWGKWMQMQWALTVPLNSPWTAGYPGKLWTCAFVFLRARRSQYCISRLLELYPAS